MKVHPVAATSAAVAVFSQNSPCINGVVFRFSTPTRMEACPHRAFEYFRLLIPQNLDSLDPTATFVQVR